MASDDEVANEKIYDKEYRRLRTLTSQTDIVEGSVSMWVCVCVPPESISHLNYGQISPNFRLH